MLNRYGCIIYGDVTDHISSDCQELDDVQRLELLNTLGKFSSLFSSLPGLAKVKGHNLKLKPDFTPKKMHPYRIPIALQQEVDRQINELLHLKLIEPSESEWAHPIVCVSKKNGSIRLCVDYRHLNSFTIADAYPMQNAKDLLFEVGQANYITVLDLTKGYWRFQWQRRQSLTQPLCDSSWSLPILCYALRDEERREYLSKSYGSGASETPGILSIIYRRCSSFLKTWEQHMKHLCSISNDSKATAIGACLSQNDEKGKENPIAFFSKKLTETQTRWATIEREAYAVIEALKRFDSWIFGAEIEVISDHNPLTYLTLTTPQSAKLTRWALALQRYNIAISYRKGVKHGNADALSRLPIPVS
ncbi:retrovirus-related Pol polyprotein from transposon opus [Trichonephila clavipes]|nr:retrovirus-related Pol polyprotein from transposon opus [Trichonephila clavipes]